MAEKLIDILTVERFRRVDVRSDWRINAGSGYELCVLISDIYANGWGWWLESSCPEDRLGAGQAMAAVDLMRRIEQALAGSGGAGTEGE